MADENSTDETVDLDKLNQREAMVSISIEEAPSPLEDDVSYYCEV